MKWIVYNLAFALVFPFLLPGFLVRMLRRGGYRARMGDRFAVYPPDIVSALARGDRVWIHAVSVGEVQVAGQLMRDWRKVEPSVRFCFSTTSSTGWKMAEKEVGPDDVLIYNPLDFPTFVTAALRTVRPRAIVLTESEIWPVFIRAAKKRGIPLFLVNARVSDRSAPRYAKAKFIFKDVFSSFTRIFAQSDLDRDRLLAAGAPADRVEVTGSFKFDVARRNQAKESELRDWIHADGRKILLGGSTWPGEDKVLLGIYAKLVERSGVPPILVIAPRHFEKADAVEANIREAGFDCIRRSRGESAGSQAAASQTPVFLADTTGELMGLYGISDFVFVGKSLCEHGSQNMIEPCLCGKPTVVGPFTENFRPVMSDLLAGGGIVQVKDAEGLERTILGWFSDGDGGLGERARTAVERRRGVVPKCTAAIRSAIPAKAPSENHTGSLGLKWTVVFSALIAAIVAGIVFVAASMHRPKPASRVEGKSVAEQLADIRSDRKKMLKPALPKFGILRTVGAYIAMVERPDATHVFLADSEAERYKPVFEKAGLKCTTTSGLKGDRRFDIVFAGAAPKGGDWSNLTERLNGRGLLACALDVRKTTAAEFKSIMDGFPSPEPHLWMPGDRDWLVTGRAEASRLKMSALLDFFSQSDRLINVDAEEAGCGSVQELFASYVGTRKDVDPAFASGDMSVLVRPEFFLAKEIPDLAWIVPDDMDEDIVFSLAEQIRRMQTVRRKIVEGSVLSDNGKVDDAIAAWSAANVSNPHDPMLLDRLYQLVVNARAFMNFGKTAEAAQCYDTYFAIRPEDLPVAEEFANALAAMRRTEESKRVRDYVDSVRIAERKAETEKVEKLRKEMMEWKQKN